MSQSTKTDDNVAASKVGWMIAGFLLLALTAFFKYSHLRIAGSIDAGLVFVLGLLVLGFASAFYVGYLQTTTQKLVADGRYKLAENGLRKGLPKHRAIGPQSFDYVADLILLARVCRETSQFEDAKNFAEEALSVLQRNDEDWIELNKKERTGEAERLYKYSVIFQQRFVALRPEALYELAASYFELGKYDQAERTLADCARRLEAYMSDLRAPEQRTAEDDENILTKDFVIASMKNSERSAAQEKLLVALHKAHDVHRLQALIFNRLKDSEREEEALALAVRDCGRAVEIMNAVIGVGVQDARLYLRRALFYMFKNDYSAALSDLNQALDKSTTRQLRYSALTNRGECYNRMGKFDLALDDFNAALKLEPKSGLVLLNRAEVYDKMGKRDLAVADKARAEVLGCRHPRLNFV